MFPPHTNWIREPVARLRATSVGIGYIITLVFKEVPVAGTLLAVQSFAAGVTTPLIVWAISGLIDALPRSLADRTDLWPSILPWLLILLAAFIIRSLDGALGDYLSQLTGLRLGAAVQHMAADRILVLREGRLVEQGSHAALLSAEGEYAELYRLQAASYR